MSEPLHRVAPAGAPSPTVATNSRLCSLHFVILLPLPHPLPPPSFQSKLLRAARGRYEAPVAAVFRRWIEAVPLRFLSLLLPPPVPPTPPSLYQSPAASPFPSPLACPATPAPATASGPPHTAAALGQWKQRLEMAAYEILGDLRTAELFDIIVDHPERWAAGRRQTDVEGLSCIVQCP